MYSVLFVLALAVMMVFINSRLRIKELQRSYQEKLEELDRISKMLVRRDFELSQTLETLRSLDESKTQFVNIAAHQLRTPISAVKWILRLVLDGDLGEITNEQREYLQECYGTNERMVKLVNDLLNVSRIESGRLTYAFEEVKISDLAKEVVNGFQSKAEKNNVVLTYRTSAPSDLTVIADVDKIRMIIENLIENALNYTSPKGKVEVSLRDQESDVIISVTDTGIGISSEDMKKLFTKFNRSEGAIKLFPNGSGLGLFLSQSIASSHGGAIKVESEPGIGSTFQFILPKNGLSAKAFNEKKLFIK